MQVSARHVAGLALSAGSVPIVDAIRVLNVGVERLAGARWCAMLEPSGISCAVALPVVHPGEEITIAEIDLQLPAETLAGVQQTEAARLRWWIAPEHASQPVVGGEELVELLPWDGWPADRAPPGVLAAFVLPRDPVVASLVRRAGRSGVESDPVARLEHIHEGIRALGLRPMQLPRGFEQRGMRLRLPDGMLTQQRANPVELALLYASCFERMGLGAVLASTRERALVGVRLADEGFPEGVVLDARRVRRAIEAGQLALFDPADPDLADPTVRVSARFGSTAELLDDVSFRFAIDLATARADGWHPLPLRPPPDLRGDGTARPIVREILAEASALPAEPISRPPATAAPDGSVTERFRHWKERLLDLSLRNRLLAFRIGARTALPLDVPDLGRFAEILLKDTVLEILPAPEPVAQPQPPEPGEDKSTDRFAAVDPEDETLAIEAVTEEGWLEATGTTRTLPFARDDEAPGLDAYHDGPTEEQPPKEGGSAAPDPVQTERRAQLDRGRIYAALDPAALMAHAVALDRATRLDLEEGGANTLYAVVGFLRWSEAGDAAPTRLAPLLMIPVVLDLQRSSRRVRIRRSPDDPIANVTLIEKLRRDFEIDLSVIASLDTDDGAIDIDGLLAAARSAIAPMSRWRIEPQVALGQLLFTKFLLWRDLEDNASWLHESTVVQHIARRVGTAYPNPVEPLPETILDDALRPEALPLVVDADSTQISAIHSALQGRSFVLQGPPGTGKSQTITNLVAAALASGRTVLVVAEKLAALDVVHRRLVEAGLGDFCLELHSHKANKRQVVSALVSVLRREGSPAAPPWLPRSAEIDESRRLLNGYVRALHAGWPLGTTFHGVSARLLDERGEQRVSVDIADPTRITEDRYRAMIEQASRFATAAAEVEPVAEHPWSDASVTRWSAAAEGALREKLAAAAEGIAGVEAVAAELSEVLGAPSPPSVARMRELVALASALSEGPLPPAAVDASRSTRFAARVGDFVDRHNTWQARSRAVALRWHPGVYRADLERLSARFGTYAASWFLTAFVMLFFPRRELLTHAKRGLPDNRTIADDLAVALQVERAREPLAAERKALMVDSGGIWAGGESEELTSLVERADQLRKRVKRARLAGLGVTDKVLDWADPETSVERRRTLQRKASEAARALDRWEAGLAALYEATHTTSDDEGQFAGIRERLQRWAEGVSQLRAWAIYGEASAAMAEVGLGAVVDAHRAGTIDADEAVGVTERSVLMRWLDAVRDAEEPLRTFSGPEHHRQVLRFRQLDAQHLDLGTRQVLWSLEQRLPRVGAEVADSSEPGILLREAAKKARHKSVRRLFSEMPNLLPRLKPCLLMSPMSVAQYLPAGGRRFDLVVFDEASQIGTHDAIGALARGAQVVVVGDSRQLPPTSFFQRAASDELPDDDDFDELESILDEAVASGLPEQMLGWHYRSRHESLIRFSNDHYYDGRLTVFPAARGRVGDLGLVWHPVPEGIYDKSRSRTNRAEARALVDHLMSSLLAVAPGERTFGVVTFSRSQQQLVSDLLDEARRLAPALEGHFVGIDEPVFVKNLENVQGDERDEILFSIGYGPDEQGRLWMNFGPLNRQGGERRLNVAITRARRQLRVFSTLTHDQIDLSRTRALGARHLKEFLRYAAEHGAAEVARHRSQDFRTAFERDVYEVLRERGYEVAVGVGCGAYRVDLAILDPERPGEYALGVELDGASYASAATARDRDRLRPSVLEGLGWKLHRVWSVDWWFDRDREVRRLERALADATSGEPWVDDEPTDEQPAGPAAATEGGEPAQSAHSPGLPRIDAYAYASPVVISEDPKSLYDAEQMPSLQVIVQQVVEAEAPLHISELTRRVGAAFGQKKLTARAKRRVASVAKGLSPPAVVRGDFVWRADEGPDRFDRVRGPAEDGTARDAESIPPEEVALAARFVLAENLAMPHADLVRETARVFGISRLGRKIAEAMSAGIALLVEQGVVEIQGDRVVSKG